jgi:hypothetical protein
VALVLTGMRPAGLCGPRVRSVDFFRNLVSVTLTHVRHRVGEGRGVRSEASSLRELSVEGGVWPRASQRDGTQVLPWSPRRRVVEPALGEGQPAAA